MVASFIPILLVGKSSIVHLKIVIKSVNRFGVLIKNRGQVPVRTVLE